jgi:glycosyltransferase involved in cell wall biosynthesis
VKTVIICHYFAPEIGAPQMRLSELARFWAEAGDEVTVLTGLPNHPTGVIPPEYRKLRFEEHRDGYRVLRSWLYATPNEGFVKKTIGHLSFMVSSVLLNTRRAGPADVVIVSSPTFFSIFSAWLLARMKRAKFVVEVRDLWPAIFVELGVLTNRFVIRALEKLELAAYRAADAVVTVSDGFTRDIVGRGIDAGKVHTIRNGVSLDRFQHEDHSNHESARHLLGANGSEPLVLYIGAHGISHSLQTVLDAARQVQDLGIHFALVGDGAEKSKLVEYSAKLDLKNVTMVGSRPADEIPGLLAAADICLVPLRKVPLFQTFIPSKMFEYFAARRAVIGALEGEAAEILRDAGAVVVEPENPVALGNAIRELAGAEQRRKEMGEQARTYVEREFDRKALAGRYRDILEETLGSGN